MNILYLSGLDEDLLLQLIKHSTIRIIFSNIYYFPTSECFVNNERIFYGPLMMEFTENYLVNSVLGSPEADLDSTYNMSKSFLETAAGIILCQVDYL